MMEEIVIGVIVTVVGGAILGFFGWLFRRNQRANTRALRNDALTEARRLGDLIAARRADKPQDDPILKDHEKPNRRVTRHDQGTQDIYYNEHMPVIADLKERFAERGIQDDMLDQMYEYVENETDIRNIQTTLAQMAARLR
jgi:hypothetical protein